MRRLAECYGTIPVRDPGTGRLIKLNSNRLAKFVNEYFGDMPILATNTLYRLERGETSPRVDTVYTIAKVFGVPPSSFLPDKIED